MPERIRELGVCPTEDEWTLRRIDEDIRYAKDGHSRRRTVWTVLTVLRPAVQWFAEEMERQLRSHDAKKGERGWRDLSAEYLDGLFIDQGTELRDALILGKPEDIVHKAVDVANVCMMIADNARRPDKKP